MYNLLSIYILINELRANNITSSNIQFTFKLPMIVNSNGILEFDSNSFYTQKIEFNGKLTINHLTIQLIDFYSRNINLNNLNFEILFKINEL